MDNTLAAIIIAGAVIYLFQAGYVTMESGEININVEGDTYNPPIGEIDADPPTAEDTIDLRLIAAPWIASTDAQNVCITASGTWHSESDWVGCEGAGSYICNDAIHIAAGTQCIGAGANWVCSLENTYCKK